jgi:hypothetical protein
MRKKLIVLWAIWHFFAPVEALAQHRYVVTGTVQDLQQLPLAEVGIALQRGTDTGILKTVFSDTVGRFSVEAPAAGTYRISLKVPGYVPYQSGPFLLQEADTLFRLEPITLSASTNQLAEVAVAARKELIVQRPDRTIVNVDALLSAAGGTALDVLQKSPGVQVDQNGDIRMRGKQGVTVYIDDKPSYLSGDDLAAYLRALPASLLDQVELIPNPPARYDAAGTGGIINLKLKSGRARGTHGSLNLSLMQGVLTSTNNSGNFNYRNNKVRAFVNASYSLNNTFTDLDLNRVYRNANQIPTAYFEQHSYFRRRGYTGLLYGGADYSVSDRTTVGFLLTGRYRQSAQLNDNTSRVLGTGRELDSTIVAYNQDDIYFKNGAANLNYRTRFKEPGHELTADADYLTYMNRTEQVYQNSGYLPDYTLQSQDVLTGHLPARIAIYSGNTDYKRTLPHQWQLAAGGKWSSSHTDNLADYSVTIGGTTHPDYGKSNQFVYRENIGAAYLNLNHDFGRLSAQSGLRWEHTHSAGHQLGNVQKRDSSFSRDYSSFFPTVYLSYKFDTVSKHQLNLNYGRRIQRPYYQDLNPFLYPMDKFTYYTGNPFLRAAFIQSLELSYSYKNKITTTLAYSRSLDEVNETIEINGGIYYSRPANLGRKTFLTANMNAVFDPWKWLNINMYTEITNIDTRSDFYNGMLRTSGSFWFIGGTVRMTAGRGWDAEMSGDYRTRIFDAQFITGSFWQANCAIQKKVSEAITLKLALNDIFYTQVIRGTITNLVNADAGWVNRRSSQTAAFTFSYRFGKAAGAENRHEATGAEAEKSRVKN